MSVKIYHNPRCSKSRQALDLLKSQNIDPEIILYLTSPINSEEIKDILKMLNISAREIIRKKESEYIDLGLNDLNISEDEIISAISNNPKLLERPIVVVDGKKAAIGRPLENISSIL